MAVNPQPVPQWAQPFLGDEEELKKLGLKFNPVWLKWFIDLIDGFGTGGFVQHNDTSGLQGGTAGQFYHLSFSTYNALTGTQTANTIYAGPATGAAAVAAFRALVTADLANKLVTYAKIQDVSATDRLLGRSTAGAGVVEEIVCTAAGRALIDDASASTQRTTLGLASTVNGTFPVSALLSGDLSSITVVNGLITATTVLP